MRGPGTWWRGKSTPEKVETYTRWSFHFFAVIEVVAVGLPVVGEIGAGLGLWLMLMVCVHGALCALTVSRALDWVRGRCEQPVWLLWTLGAATAVLAATALAVAEYGPDGDGVDTAAGGVFGVVLIFGAGTIALGLRSRRHVYALVVGFAAGAGLVAFLLGQPAPVALVSMVSVLFGGAFLAFTAVFSVWLLKSVYELDEARETRARLAVAEERLRFGRDLHDVMGRNLAVIALKSELAVQLARRGRPEAVEQMIEVQRIARESQREVRDVVRGYREADLGVELAGAQGVLTAAGIECVVTGEAAGLPVEVQSALAWVVREATTNVLRHGDAVRCAVGVRVREGRVMLTVENDGVAGASDGGGGSGLAGLRERLAAVDGTLAAGPAGEGLFRLVAEVPLAEAGAGVREVTV
ncbi:two-component system, NarL family, sensor histidine kinase DesK [Streptomyces sp. cf386]|uniref:sensor histidine kinase n=1 Tax=Streptomyces sp. cf386 TaxID=1761904 RepID=UPI0008893651|nr:histidine kinase [Streptomyces sp. cf386]SDP52826.1 two-component system, NarL family, sensor histidine kinase DesK [Streptomyces sp. cf386]